jgi:hypothetical protein
MIRLNAVDRLGVLGLWTLMVACSGTTTMLNRQNSNEDGGGTTGTGGSTGDGGGSMGGSGGGLDAAPPVGGSGGTGGIATGGASGDGGAPPVVPGVTSSNKLDLLIVVDNSSSMTDKQDVLANTLPDLVARLPGVQDLHVGVITSSLGGHGATGPSGTPHHCEPGGPMPNGNDHAHLLGTLPRAAGLGLTKGFIEWTPAAGTAALSTQVHDLVRVAGQAGCGLEAPFEAMYRFLADPEPPLNIVLAGNPPRATSQGVDNEILAQRKAFLRSDSVLAIVMLTDENDCSIRDTDQFFYAAMLDNFLPEPSTVCGVNPNDPCCYSCGLPAPAGCVPDPKCDPPIPSLTAMADSQNLRCFEQKRRFGIDFLYPVKRYVNALRAASLCPTNSDLSVAQCRRPDGPFPGDAGPSSVVPNPLYSDLSGTGAPTRSSSMVHFLGIVGAPWQSFLATEDDQGNAYPVGELHYQSPAQLASSGTWSRVLGNPAASPPVLPTESHMQESVDPRPGVAPPSSGYLADPIVGHEWVIPQRNDLQYACTFALPQAIPCVDSSCDCYEYQQGENDPLCQNSNGEYGTTQYFAKAYPGLRELELVKRLGGVAASICPRNLTDMSAQDFGYRPALEALAKDLATSMP